MSKQSKVHPSTRDLNVYGGYEANPIGSNQKAPTVKQHESVRALNRATKAQWGGNEISEDRSHIQGPASTSKPIGYVVGENRK